jgi:hypothetical protein
MGVYFISKKKKLKANKFNNYSKLNYL